MFESRNPFTEQVVATFAPHSDAEIEARIAAAERAFRAFRRTSVDDRCRLLRNLANVLRNDRERWARLMVEEMGKTIAAARAEVDKCAWVCEHYATHGPAMLRPERAAVERGEAEVVFQPLGAVLAVMPWNFPFWQVFRFLAPNLLAGNVALLKHASNVPRCALALEEIGRRAGLPDGVFATLLIEASRVPSVLADDRIAAATLTGSTAAGASVAAEAGRHVKKTVLELGGSDPFLVLPSADLDAAARTAVQARIINNGQSCIAAKRFFVHADVAEAFLARFVAGMEAVRLGDPMDEATEVGPLATRAIRDEVARQVDATLARGARRCTRPREVPPRGFFYPPAVLVDVPADAPAACEEVFGPVASVWVLPTLDAMLAAANASAYGLGASVWTRDPDEARRCVEELETGMVFVNAMVASDPRLPFGGVKRSGYGRELGLYGLREFVNIKTVWRHSLAGDHGVTE